MITIEKDIPIPPRRTPPPRAPKYPFADMVVGDSFFVETDNETTKRKFSSINLSSRKHAKSVGGGRFVTRIVDGGVRCWRAE